MRGAVFRQDCPFEPLKSGLPAGLLASPCLVQVIRCTVYLPVIKVGTVETFLHPCTNLRALTKVEVVSLKAGVSEVMGPLTTVFPQAASTSCQDKIGEVDLLVLTRLEQPELKSSLWQNSSVFSSSNGDLGCTALISCEKPLIDQTTIQQQYW